MEGGGGYASTCLNETFELRFKRASYSALKKVLPGTNMCQVPITARRWSPGAAAKRAAGRKVAFTLSVASTLAGLRC